VVGAGVGVGVSVGITDGVGFGVVVAVGEGTNVGEGEILAAGVADFGGSSLSGEVDFCGDGVLRGVVVPLGAGDFAALDGAADGAGNLRADAEDFGFGVGIGFGVGVCAVRSTPR
jgi:hypothetical protein